MAQHAPLFRLGSRLLALPILLLLAAHARAESCGGLPAQAVTVTRCYDGDTCTLSNKTKVRLAGIDSPEKRGTMGGKGQSGSDEAAKAIREKLIGRSGVTMAVHDTDRYGRTVGEFCADGRSINVEMVREGHAMVFRGKVKTRTIDKAALESAETQARAEKKGIWASGDTEDPSAYRRKLKEASMNYKEK